MNNEPTLVALAKVTLPRGVFASVSGLDLVDPDGERDQYLVRVT